LGAVSVIRNRWRIRNSGAGVISHGKGEADRVIKRARKRLVDTTFQLAFLATAFFISTIYVLLLIAFEDFAILRVVAQCIAKVLCTVP